LAEIIVAPPPAEQWAGRKIVKSKISQTSSFAAAPEMVKLAAFGTALAKIFRKKVKYLLHSAKNSNKIPRKLK